MTAKNVPEALSALEDHPYGPEADQLINLVFDSGPSSPMRKLAVAEWLREYVAARAFGCTGLTADPDGPTIDAAGSGEDERPEDYHRAAREPRTAYDPGAGPFRHGYGNPA
jgi:hypothetical protein